MKRRGEEARRRGGEKARRGGEEEKRRGGEEERRRRGDEEAKVSENCIAVAESSDGDRDARDGEGKSREIREGTKGGRKEERKEGGAKRKWDKK